MVRVPAWRGAVAVGWLLLAACTAERGSSLPGGTPSPGVTPPGSASATPTRAELEAQALATVRAYYDELNRGYATGTVVPLRNMTTSDCACRRTIDFIESAWTSGRLTGISLIIKRITTREVNLSFASFSVVYDGTQGEQRNQRGEVIRRIPAEQGKLMQISATTNGERWLVKDIAVLS